MYQEVWVTYATSGTDYNAYLTTSVSDYSGLVDQDVDIVVVWQHMASVEERMNDECTYE